jgi:hypothetical protein
MTDEERRIISDYVARVSGASPGGAPAAGNPAGNPWGGSVPATQARPPLPPVDPEADAFIGQLLQQYPEARYRLTQTAFVQEAALVEAQNRIRQLEWERDQARSQVQQAQAQPAAPRQGGGFLGGLFGGGQQRPAQPAYAPQPQGYAPQPQPQYPPGYNPQAFQQPQQQGPSFLGGALRTAAGVAGGMVVGNMLMNAFSHHGQDASAAAAGGFGGGHAASPGGSPWQNPDAVAASQGWDGGGGTKDFGAPDKFAPQPAYQPDATPTSWDGGGSSYAPDDGAGSGGDGGDYGSSSNDC